MLLIASSEIEGVVGVAGLAQDANRCVEIEWRSAPFGLLRSFVVGLDEGVEPSRVLELGDAVEQERCMRRVGQLARVQLLEERGQRYDLLGVEELRRQ